MDFPKVFYCIFKMAHLTPAPLTPALINAAPKNNAELGPALKETHKVSGFFLIFRFISVVFGLALDHHVTRVFRMLVQHLVLFGIKEIGQEFESGLLKNSQR